MKRNLSYYKSMVIRLQDCIRAESEPIFRKQMLLAVSAAKKRVKQIELRAGIGIMLAVCLAGCEPPAEPSSPSKGPTSPSKQVSSLSTTVFMNTSAYCVCPKCCAPYADGITASGKPAIGKLIAADRRYPFGTVMVIPGYGRAVVEDRGGAISDNRIDLLFPDHQSALQWGRQYLKVEVLQ